MVKDADYDSATDIFVIKDLELHEISVVSIPANADSTFSVSKAFEDGDELIEFKKQFEVQEEASTDASKHEIDSEALVKTIVESFDKKLQASEENILNKIKESKEMPDKGKEVEKEVKVEVSSEASGVEKLMADFIAKLDDDKSTTKDAIDSLREELNEKTAEIEALTKSKMEFEGRSDIQISKGDQDSAVLLSKIMGRGVGETDFAKQYLNKAGDHLASVSANWESEFSTRLENDIRQKLIVEPLFNRTINMNAATMNIPVNPEADLGLWVPTGDFKGANSTGSASQTHLITDTILTAHKLVSREYIGYEEEEDAIIPLLPIIRDAIVRRMARTSDIALLRGTGTAGAQPNHDPIAGLTKIAATAGGTQVTTVSIGGANVITVADLGTVREGLGVWGLDPSELVYVVSTEAYYDLLKDPDFRTMDLVGSNATILTGQIGSVNGSPVVVSGEFEAKAATKAAVVCVNKSNFVVGNLRSFMTERDRLIVEQQNVIVTSRRMAFLDVITGKSVSILNWVV